MNNHPSKNNWDPDKTWGEGQEDTIRIESMTRNDDKEFTEDDLKVKAENLGTSHQSKVEP